MVHFRFPIHQLPSALQDFASEMETIVDQVFNKNECKSEGSESSDTVGSFTPAMDIYETEQQYDLYMDLPGVKSDGVSIEMHDERLVVHGTLEPVARSEASVHRQERRAGKFSRSVRLPKQLDAEKIEAQFDNGVLHVVLPKKAKPAPRTIEIRTNPA